MTNPTWSIWLRLGRADEHRVALQESVKGFLGDNPYGVTTQFLSDERAVSIYVDRMSVPEHERQLRKWGIAVGDIAHNLRSSLDNLAWLATEASGMPPPERPGDPYRDVSFPLVREEGRWMAARERCLWGVPDKMIPVFYGSQPFVTGPNEPEREPLAVLHALWNFDKHRAAPVLETDLKLSGAERVPEELGVEQLSMRREPFQDGVEMARFTYGEGVRQRDVSAALDYYLRFVFSAAFGAGISGLQPGALLLDTVMSLYNATQDVLLRYEEAA